MLPRPQKKFFKIFSGAVKSEGPKAGRDAGQEGAAIWKNETIKSGFTEMRIRYKRLKNLTVCVEWE